MRTHERVVIKVERLSKHYVINHNLKGQDTFREAVTRALTAPLRHLISRSTQTGKEELWALKDVNFEVSKGEVVGIIGPNGAGKSTLLKILSRITVPTQGRVEMRGRVTSLLEVGTGFHQELTGAENIYLNGAILGMSHTEISRKFEDIVGFAGVKKFIDTPVKHYSSGMYVRLAFAVAAHLEPDILIVDEVLAVGDAEFQKKSLGKMAEVAGGGRTVLFVSHNMSAVNRLCGRCLLLKSGSIAAQGETKSVTARYIESNTSITAVREWKNTKQQMGDEIARLIAVSVRQKGKITDTVDIRFPIEVEITYEAFSNDSNLLSAVSFFNADGIHLFLSADLNDPRWSRPRGRGVYRSVCYVPGNLFAEGMVHVGVEVSTRDPAYRIHFLALESVGFQVIDIGEPGSVRGNWGRDIPGVMRPACQWSTERLPAHFQHLQDRAADPT